MSKFDENEKEIEGPPEPTETPMRKQTIIKPKVHRSKRNAMIEAKPKIAPRSYHSTQKKDRPKSIPFRATKQFIGLKGGQNPLRPEREVYRDNLCNTKIRVSLLEHGIVIAQGTLIGLCPYLRLAERQIALDYDSGYEAKKAILDTGNNKRWEIDIDMELPRK